MGKEIKKIKKELAYEDLMDKVFVTAIGNRTIPQLNEDLGLPKLYKVYAKVEAKTKSTRNPFIVVDRLIDIEMRYNKDVVVRGIKSSLANMLDYTGIEIRYRRMSNYDPIKMINATNKELVNARCI